MLAAVSEPGDDLVRLTPHHRGHAGGHDVAGGGHLPTANRGERDGVVRGEHPGDRGGGEFADGVPGDDQVVRQFVPLGEHLIRQQGGGHYQWLRDGRVLDGVRVRHGAELDQIQTGELGPGRQPLAGALELKPRGEHAWSLGALTGG
jgi:hypothetical protein